MSILQRLRRLIPRTRRGRWRVYIYGTIILIPALDMLYVQCERHIPLGRDTTYINAPLKSDGSPDYVAWFDRLRGEGVKPEDNAAIPIFEITCAGKADSNYYRGLRAAWGLPPDTSPTLFKEAYKFLFDKFSGASDDTQEQASKDFQNALWENDAVKRMPHRGPGSPLVTEWLDINGPALAAFHTALQRPKYFVPLLRVDGSKPAELHQAMDDLWMSRYHGISTGFALSVRAGARAGMGDSAGACADILDYYRFAQLRFDEEPELMQSPATAILSMVDELPPDQAGRLLKELPEFPPVPAVNVRNAFDRAVALESLQYTARHGIAAGWDRGRFGEPTPAEFYFVTPGYATLTALFVPIHFARIARDVNHWYDGVDRIARLDSAVAQENGIRAKEKEMDATMENAGIGDRAALRVVYSPEYYASIDRGARNADALARLALALRIYQAAHGSFPESLSALVPDFLSAIPMNYQNGQPWAYERQAEGYVICQESGKEPAIRLAAPAAQLDLAGLRRQF